MAKPRKGRRNPKGAPKGRAIGGPKGPKRKTQFGKKKSGTGTKAGGRQH